jgi:hypothetical protein
VGQLVGTLQYMSPEQVEADPNDLDVRSDVYSLGVVLYELLCDGLPYEVSGARVFEATRIIREQSPTRPSSIDRALRGDLETIVLQALEKDRDRRYQSAAELAADLRRYLASEPITARPSSAMYQIRVFARRNRAVVGGLAATFVALVAGLIGIAAMNVRLEQRNIELERIAYASEVRSVHELWRTGMFTGLDERLDALPTEYRGLEWDLLRHRVEPIAAQEIRFGDDRPITVLEASPDGSRFLVGSRSGVARIYQASSTWQIQRELPTQANRLADGDFDLAGERIILSLETGGLLMFDAANGRELARSPDTPSFSARFSPDGTHIASVDGRGRISILASDDLTVLDRFESRGAVNRIEYSADGRHLLTACNDGWARLIDSTARRPADRHWGAGRTRSRLERRRFVPPGVPVAPAARRNRLVCQRRRLQRRWPQHGFVWG